jgi:hypothetical protein
MTYNNEDGPVYSVLNGKFTPMAVLLTSGTSYTVPAGATSMKAWAVGGGGSAFNGTAGGAGGTAFKTWSVSGGNTISYVVGSGGPKTQNLETGPFIDGANSSVAFNNQTIVGNGGLTARYSGYSSGGFRTIGAGGSFSGGDGGANGGSGEDLGWTSRGGAVGGNSQTLVSCGGRSSGRRPASDVSGLLAAVTLAGGTATQTCITEDAAFGAGGNTGEKFYYGQSPGLGGGGGDGYATDRLTETGGGGAVVLYFT